MEFNSVGNHGNLIFKKKSKSYSDTLHDEIYGSPLQLTTFLSRPSNFSRVIKCPMYMPISFLSQRINHKMTIFFPWIDLSDLTLLAFHNYCPSLYHDCHYGILAFQGIDSCQYQFTSPGSDVANVDLCLAKKHEVPWWDMVGFSRPQQLHIRYVYNIA